jgi:CO/xanthine dehydrogenase FAD-binding subunit
LLINSLNKSVGCLLDWYRPISLNELIFLRHTYPGDESKLVFGNTRVEIERKSFQMKYRRLICITHIKKLQELKRTNNSFYLGAGVTFTQLKSKLIQWNNDKQNNDGGICQALLDQLKHFGSTQIRNVASIGGNLIGASPM